MRFIATADWQLGMTAHYLDADARPRYREARFDAIRTIGDYARTEGAHFVVVCGDVFESNQLDRAVLGKTFDALREIPVPVYLLPGNHDHLGPGSIYDAGVFQPPSNVIVQRNSDIIEIADGFELMGIPWYSKAPEADILNQALTAVPARGEGTFRLICAHGGASTLSADDSPDIIDVPRLEEQLDQKKGDLVVLGDRHSVTEVTGRIWYPGTPEVTARVEERPGHVLLFDVDVKSAQFTVETLPTGKWSFDNHEVELLSDADIDHFEEELGNWPRKSTAAVWLAISGRLSMPQKARLDALLEEYRSLFALLELWERQTKITVIPADSDFSELGLSGFARAALEELTAAAQSDDATAGDALGLLYHLAKEHQ